MTETVSYPLTLIMPLREDVSIGEIYEYLKVQNADIGEAMDRVGTVHYARFVVFDASAPNLRPSADHHGPYKLAVITTYDGDFDFYIRGFVDQLADVFDRLLGFTTDGGTLIPVRENVEALTAWARKNDASQRRDGLPTQYSAYPSIGVQDIKAKFAG